jgi:hypothetical protein
MRLVAVLTFILSCVTIPAIAQTESIIDTRGQQQTVATPLPARCGSGGAAWPRPDEYTESSRVKAELIVTNPESIVVGEPFEFELILTNETAGEITVPQSLDGKDVVDPGVAIQHYEDDDIYFELQPTDPDVVNQAPRFSANLALFSSHLKFSTFVPLRPGDSVRILGTATFRPGRNLRKPESGEMEATLSSYFEIRRAGRRRTKQVNCNGYESFREVVRTIRSDNSVGITVRWP